VRGWEAGLRRIFVGYPNASDTNDPAQQWQGLLELRTRKSLRAPAVCYSARFGFSFMSPKPYGLQPKDDPAENHGHE
jgi:hypothetical protein